MVRCGKYTRAVPPAQTLSDQASIRCDSAKNKRRYLLLLASGAQEVLPLAVLGLICAVLLQVLQFGGGRRVVSLAAAVCSLPEEEEGEEQIAIPILLVFLLFISLSSTTRKHFKSTQSRTPDSETVSLSPVRLQDRRLVAGSRLQSVVIKKD